jgi:hypothetical protein
MALNDNKRGVVLLSDLEHEGMTMPAGKEIDFGDDLFEASLVAAGIAEWGKGPVPDSITPLQAMTSIEMSEMAVAFGNVMSSNPRAQQMFSLATEIKRTSPIVEGLRLAAGKTAGEIDDLFRLAATLK